MRDELSQAEPANPNAASDIEPVDVMRLVGNGTQTNVYGG